MSLADATAHRPEVVNRVSTQPERVTVTVHGQPSAILLAAEDLERLEETIAVLADNKLLRDLAASDDDIAAGRVETADELAAAMAQRRPTGQDGSPQAQPCRGPPSKPRSARHRAHPPALPRTHPGLRCPPHQGEPQRPRNHALPQALHRPPTPPILKAAL